MMRSIPFGKPLVEKEEQAAVRAVLEGTTYVHGPVSKQFEAGFAAFTGAPHAISVSSCTAGMHLIYFTLGIGPGDEVIVPAQTHAATAHAVELTGARAVFADVIEDTGNIDPAAVAAAVTDRTRAVAVVHYLGMAGDIGPVAEIARANNLFLLEDCALAVGTCRHGVHAGLLGDAGVFSFYPVKHMTTAEGGMIIARNPDLAERLSLLKAFGVNRAHGERKLPGQYDVVDLGFNCRMSEIHAAIGVEQLKKVPNFLERRRANFERLKAGLAPLEEIRVLDQSENESVNSHYCLSILLGDRLASLREPIIRDLNEAGVGTSIYYPRAVPLMTYYSKRYGYRPDSFPNAEMISSRSIALPVGPHLDNEDMDYIADAVQMAVGRTRDVSGGNAVA